MRMANPVVFSVYGLRELGENFAKLSEEVQKNLAKKAVGKAAAIVRDTARYKAPRDTGALRASIVAGRIAKLSSPGYEVWSVGVWKTQKAYVKNTANRRAGRAGQSWAKMYDVDGPTYYWRFVEYGTVRMAARPFLRPALEENIQKAENAIVNTLRNGIMAALKTLPQVPQK